MTDNFARLVWEHAWFGSMPVLLLKILCSGLKSDLSPLSLLVASRDRHGNRTCKVLIDRFRMCHDSLVHRVEEPVHELTLLCL